MHRLSLVELIHKSKMSPSATTTTKTHTGDASPTQTTQRTRPRQKPGAACEECRRRKLRCDRRQPQCGSCQATGVPCHTTTVRAARGPKPGYLKDLKARIGKSAVEFKPLSNTADCLCLRSSRFGGHSHTTGPAICPHNISG